MHQQAGTSPWVPPDADTTAEITTSIHHAAKRNKAEVSNGAWSHSSKTTDCQQGGHGTGHRPRQNPCRGGSLGAVCEPLAPGVPSRDSHQNSQRFSNFRLRVNSQTNKWPNGVQRAGNFRKMEPNSDSLTRLTSMSRIENENQSRMGAISGRERHVRFKKLLDDLLRSVLLALHENPPCPHRAAGLSYHMDQVLEEHSRVRRTTALVREDGQYG